MDIAFDIDATLCQELPAAQRCLAYPLDGAIEAVNYFYDLGHTITIFSARGWTEYAMTEDWLRRHGVKYHRLILGKPVYDVFVDDRAITHSGDWKKTLKGLKEKVLGIKEE